MELYSVYIACVLHELCVCTFSASFKKEEFRFASCGWKIMMIVKNIGDGGLNQPCMIFLQTCLARVLAEYKNATQSSA